MKPEARDYLAKARQLLDEARAVFAIQLVEAAGRSAYLAAFHAAQAFIFERTGNIAKTHSGVRSEFSRLARNEPGLDQSFLSFLARAYALKEAADYGMGPNAKVPPERAAAAIDMSDRFIEVVARLLGDIE